MTNSATLSPLAQKGLEWYEQIKAEVEPNHWGEFIIINTRTGEYELGTDEVEVSDRAIARFGGDKGLLTLRVGRIAARRLGGPWRP